MNSITYEHLQKKVAEDLSLRIQELHKIVGDIGYNFRNLGLSTAVWLPVKIHTINIGGIDAESYIGYSRIEGRWGLCVHTLEHDHETHVFVSQRVYNLDACGNVEIVMNALKTIPDLVRCIDEVVKQQVEILTRPNAEIERFRNPGCEF
jgi:hypothetical protein